MSTRRKSRNSTSVNNKMIGTETRVTASTKSTTVFQLDPCSQEDTHKTLPCPDFDVLHDLRVSWALRPVPASVGHMTDLFKGIHGLQTADKALGQHFGLWLGMKRCKNKDGEESQTKEQSRVKNDETILTCSVRFCGSRPYIRAELFSHYSTLVRAG
ncbi:hypothetical protein BJV78DRAFT_95569 [Lactifluus subvellereus]|nr:hypothetical protein BJV78DRAFT_95569 [Lactifluus subvellereus]